MAIEMALTAAQTVLAVVQTLLATLDLSLLNKVCSSFDYKSELDKLKDIVSTIEAVRHDADATQHDLSHEAENLIEKLRDALYDVDDLLDELNTIAQSQDQMAGGEDKIFEKVKCFFSRSNQLLVAMKYRSRIINDIKKKLEAIARNHSSFGSGFDIQHKRRSLREESSSYLREEKIIGRDDDKKIIINMLLDSNSRENVSFVTIVGMGGLGKTTLAQLVYNDDKIKTEFHLRLWVCVSDEFSMKEILRKILSAADVKCENLSKDQLQKEVLKKIEGKKYLLILDDVWNESRDKWVELRDFLIRGGEGSKVLVTSRSKMVARGVGNDPIHELQGLTEDDSLQLFQLMAFENVEQEPDRDLVEIGKDIVKKCCHIPLSIRVVGTLLYGQRKHKWFLFQKNDLAKIENANDRTIATLKLSYYHLTPSLRTCFSYCSLFPKDHRIQKVDLINLWVANGCINIPPCEGQSIEDVGEEYFWILLERCFFQDIQRDPYGDISSCKIHDLMHDLALDVGGQEFLMLSATTNRFHKTIRHLCIPSRCSILERPSNFLAKRETVRTFFQIMEHRDLVCKSNAIKILSNFRCLRSLDLRSDSLRTIPSTISRLIHLRYLDLSGNREVKKLPKSITKLRNLQILKLRWCLALQTLPEHFSRLVNLRHLDIDGCNALTHMPTGLKNLACLHTLTMFVVGGKSKEVQMRHLEDLKALVNLKGNLTIRVRAFYLNEASNVRETRDLLSSLHLRELKIQFTFMMKSRKSVESDVDQEMLLEDLKPNSDLKSLEIRGYQGLKLPRPWASLENTVEIKLVNLPRLQYLPSLCQLYHLKRLKLEEIPNLEYVESDNNQVPATSGSEAIGFAFFPSLERLCLKDLTALKGWWKDGVMLDVEVNGHDEDGIRCNGTGENNGGNKISSLLLFRRLCYLTIDKCPNMKSFPPCPYVSELRITNFNEEILFKETRRRVDNHNHDHATSMSSTATSSQLDIGASDIVDDSRHLVPPAFALKQLYVDNIGFMSNLPKESVQGLVDLEIADFRIESLSTIEEVFQTCASSLQYLQFSSCKKLKSLSGGGIEHLTSLQTLKFFNAEELELEDEGRNAIPWRSLHSLSSLTLRGEHKMVNLPVGLQYVTTLQSLCILNCCNLTALPEWLDCLTSLRSLEISNCRELRSLPEAMSRLTSLTRLNIENCHYLTDRCRSPNGADWPKIQHISNARVIKSDVLFC